MVLDPRNLLYNGHEPETLIQISYDVDYSHHSFFFARLSFIFSHNFHAGRDKGTTAMIKSSKYFSALINSPIPEITMTSKKTDIDGKMLHALMMSKQADVSI